MLALIVPVLFTVEEPKGMDGTQREACCSNPIPPDLGHCQLTYLTRVPCEGPAALSAQLGSKAKGIMPNLPFLSPCSESRWGDRSCPSPQPCGYRGVSAPVWKELGRGVRFHGFRGRKEAGGQGRTRKLGQGLRILWMA